MNFFDAVLVVQPMNVGVSMIQWHFLQIIFFCSHKTVWSNLELNLPTFVAEIPVWHWNHVNRRLLLNHTCNMYLHFFHKCRLGFSFYRSSRPETFCKKGVLKNFTKFTGEHLHQGLFFNFIKKEALAQVFFCEFCEIFKNTFSYRTPSVAASLFRFWYLTNCFIGLFQ